MKNTANNTSANFFPSSTLPLPPPPVALSPNSRRRKGARHDDHASHDDTVEGDDDDDAVALDEEDERLERCVRRGRVGILVPPLTLAARDDNLRNHNAAGADAVAC